MLARFLLVRIKRVELVFLQGLGGSLLVDVLVDRSDASWARNPIILRFFFVRQDNKRITYSCSSDGVALLSCRWAFNSGRVRALDYLIKGSGKLARGVEVRGISATRFYVEQWRDTDEWRLEGFACVCFCEWLVLESFLVVKDSNVLISPVAFVTAGKDYF